MKRLQLDFSPHRTHLRNLIGGVAFAACLLALFWLLADQRHLQQRIAQYDVQHNQASKRTGQPTSDPAMLAEERQAREVAHALALPWDMLLGALEKVQAQSAGVHLLAVQPNPAKSEVLLSGEAEDFSTLMAYVQALRVEPQFSDVVLINQRFKDESSQTRLVFNLVAQWKL